LLFFLLFLVGRASFLPLATPVAAALLGLVRVGDALAAAGVVSLERVAGAIVVVIVD
jgi:hypothetical protein